MKVHRERGAALVELAISLFLLVLILFGTIEFGRAMYIRNTLNMAAREGARMASVTPPPVSTASVVTHVESLIPFDQTGISVSVTTDPASFATGSTITVAVSLPFETVVPLLITQLDSITLTGQASMRYEY
jgi:Flp pilus assembly protein TadG